MKDLEAALAVVDGWGADHAAVAVVGPAGVVAEYGDQQHQFPWASVTKLVTALAVLIASERGDVVLDEPAGPSGATVRHLLAHAGGLAFEGKGVLAAPGTRRIYSNPGYDLLGALLSEQTGSTAGEVLSRDVLRPLGMGATELVDRPSQGLIGPIGDLAALGREFLRPTLVSPSSASAMRTVAFPGLAGVLPGVGRFEPLDWGLGPELRDAKVPHWTGTRNSSGTFGHFGGAGTFIWVDQAIDLALACLTDRAYGPWALETWPALSDSVIGVLTPRA